MINSNMMNDPDFNDADTIKNLYSIIWPWVLFWISIKYWANKING